jgi:RNA polymerase sigma-70 factor (ECF subfamily)
MTQVGRSDEDDEIALALFKKGDKRGAVEKLMQVHEEIVFAYCMRELRDRPLSEDVTQQVFMQAQRDLDRFRGDSPVRSWLIGIARNRCKDAIKSTNRRDAKFEQDDEAVTGHEDPSATPNELFERAQENGALEACMAELSDHIRETVLLRFMADMTYEEMSTVLGVKADTLCVRVARALPLLKKCLEQKGWKP